MVLGVAKVIFILGSVRENHGIITFTCASKHQQRRVIFIVFSLAPSKKNSIKVQRELERIDQKQKITQNIHMCTRIILTRKHT